MAKKKKNTIRLLSGGRRKSAKQLLKEVDDLLLVGKHKPITAKCKHCSEPHTTSQHASHGHGSFARTHGSDEIRLGRSLTSAGADDLLALLEPGRRGR